ENGVAGEREDDLTPRDRRRRGQRAGPLPRRDEDDRTGQRGDREREQVGEAPADPERSRAETPRWDQLVAATVRPAEAQARPGPRPVEDHLERMLPRREAELRPGLQRIA